MKKLTLLCLLACTLSAWWLHSETITGFPESDFWIVNHTLPMYSGAKPPKDTIIGYEYEGSNRYQLTDTVPFMTVAIWNKQKLDLNKNWQFDFRMFLDTGQHNINKTKPIYDTARKVSDGICFVMHTADSPQNLVGGMVLNIGYGGVAPSSPIANSSFAIEFDTEHNGVYERYDRANNTAHVSYLKNGDMQALPGTYKPMQNSWATSVARGKWFSVRVVWRKNFDTLNNAFLHYDLLTYIEEMDPSNPQHLGQMFLRDSMRFNSLDDIVTGLEVGSNCQALVTWGVTSSTCESANHQMIEFNALQVEDVEYNDSLVINLRIGYKNVGDGALPWGMHETLYQAKPDCNLLPNKLSDTDTIRSMRFGCIKAYEGNNWWIDLEGLDISEAEWYIYDSLVAKGPGQYDNLDFNLMEYKYLFMDSSDVVVTAVIKGKKYVFEFGVDNEDNRLAASITQTLGIQVDTNGNGVLEIDNNSLKQAIQLPASGNCRYLNFIPVMSDGIVRPPKIDSNDILTFEFDSTFCSTSIPIQLQCSCPGNFILTVRNKDCKTAACDGVVIVDGEMMGSPNPALADELYAKQNDSMAYAFSMAGYSSKKKVVNVEVKDPWIIGGDGKFTNYQITEGDSNSARIVFMFLCGYLPAYGGGGIWGSTSSSSNLQLFPGSSINWLPRRSVEICLTFEDGSVCCKKVNLEYHCWNRRIISSLKLFPVPVTDQITIDYELLPEALELQLPLKIDIYDQFGNLRINVKNSVPSSAGETIQVNISELNAGVYYILFEMGEYIEGIDFIKE